MASAHAEGHAQTLTDGRHGLLRGDCGVAARNAGRSRTFQRSEKLVTRLATAATCGAIGVTIVSAAGPSAGYQADRNPAVLTGSTEPSVEYAVAAASPSIVKLATTNGQLQEVGSGIVLSADGLIITNSHVISAIRDSGTGLPVKAEATFADGRIAPFTVVGTDPITDVAVVHAQGVSRLTPITFGCSGGLQVGQQVVAVGSPLGADRTVGAGIISALHQPVRTGMDAGGPEPVLDVIQTDAAVNPGSSGGALIDIEGHLVGVNSEITPTPDDPAAQDGGLIGPAFAVPADQARRVAEEMLATGNATHAYLGAGLADDVTARGATITEIRAGGPAASAGLVPNLVVTAVDDRMVVNADAVLAAIVAKTPGETALLTVVDETGAVRGVPVVLASDLDWP